jgi:hypothetical protein
MCGVMALAACGGGGGDAGSSPFGSGSGSGTGSTGGSTGGSTAAYTISVDVQRAGSSTAAISSTETVQAVATVTSSNGGSVEGVVVTFAESQSALLKFAPSSRTALTDSTGKATIDLSANDAANTGATTVNASATVAASSVTASKSIQITAASSGGGAPAVPAAINFIGSNPSGTAIVIKGTGGTGRSESAILSFRVVDLSNAPINGVAVTFSINADNGGATISPTTATSNSDGLVSTTVSSGINPASIVVQASAGSAPVVTSQSDTLIVSNSVPFEGGFEIVAAKYNLDGRKTGDSTDITAYVRDKFGNPVPDGVAVNFVTNYGAVASSTLGGCTTVNGICKVVFRVQDPRPISDGIATVTATLRVGDGSTVIAPQSLQINMAGASGSSYMAVDPTTLAPITQLRLTSCKQSFELMLSDGSGHAPAAGTTISTPFTSTGVVVTVKNGSPVLDQLAPGFPPVIFGIEIDLTSTELAPLCNAGGTVSISPDFFRFGFTTPGSLLFTQRIDLAFPR